LLFTKDFKFTYANFTKDNFTKDYFTKDKLTNDYYTRDCIQKFSTNDILQKISYK